MFSLLAIRIITLDILGIGEFFQTIYDWLTGWLTEAINIIIEALNPVTWIIWAIEALAHLLPPGLGLQAQIDEVNGFVDTTIPTFQMVNYFFPVHFFVVCVGIFMAYKLATVPFRMWRVLRSFIT